MRRVGAALVLAVCSSCSTDAPIEVDRAALVSAADLHYTRQVERSEAGLPIGNGRTGSLVWTESDRLRLQVNRVDVFARNASVTVGEECDWCGGCAFVDVIAGDGAFPEDDTVQHLSAYEAVATVEGRGVRARVFAWSERDVIAVELEDRRAESAGVELELRMLRPPLVQQADLDARSALRDVEGRPVLEQSFEALQHHCRSAVAVDVLGADGTLRRPKETAWRLAVPAGSGPVTFLISSAATLSASGSPGDKALRDLAEARRLGTSGMLRSHREHWREFWSRSYVSAHSADGAADLLQEHWAWTLYIMGSSSRGRFPPKFNGMLWSTGGDTRRWGSQFWWWNTQILYRPLLAANHAELMEPLLHLYGGALEGGRTAARQQWGSQGVFLGETSDYDGLEELPEEIASELRAFLLCEKTLEQTSAAFRDYALARNGYNSRWNWLHHQSTAPFSWVTHIAFSGAQIAWHHWLRYQYTLEEEWLRRRAYPLIRGTAEFYRNHPNLKRGDDGRYHLHLMNDQELLWGCRDAHNEIWAMRGILTIALTASEILQVDADLRPLWSTLLESLAEPPLSTDPDVVEGSFYPHPSGRPVWALGRTPCRHVEGLSSDNVSRPCVDYDLWSLESEDAALTQVAVDSYESDPMRLEAVGGKRGYALSEVPLSAAAMGRADDVRVILPDHISRDLLANRLTLEDGEQAQSIEPVATVATATQWALLQSKPARCGGDPVIRLFPAWPRDWDASFELAAREGFLVRSSMSGGEIPSVEIDSVLGGTCRVRNPWGENPVALLRAGREADTLRGSLLVFETAPGEAIALRPVVDPP